MSAKNPSYLDRFVTESPLDTSTDDEDGLPTFGEEQYRAHARPANKPVFAIHLLKPSGRGRTFEYVDLRSRCADDDDFDNSCFRLAFLGMRPVIVTVKGRNLLRLYDYIHQHRMAWVMEIRPDRDYVPDGATVITHVTVEMHPGSLT